MDMLHELESTAELFVIDWSFVLVLVLVAFVAAALLVRRARARRRARREERRAAHRAYRRWLRNSGLHPLALPPRATSRRRR
ncbi:hypothetical protein [Pseudorhodoferax sp.]|uniref:hypothetical protein n=1 Tax=Pseudorhodoferax sp. TaxID=1993553 RepID=UPI002DD660EA|nr:hypothetical protein [Pseudorhodoferax sp.]